MSKHGAVLNAAFWMWCLLLSLWMSVVLQFMQFSKCIDWSLYQVWSPPVVVIAATVLWIVWQFRAGD